MMSQCKNPFPEGSEKIKINNSYELDFEEIDYLLNSGQIITFNHAFSGLFNDDLSGHIKT